MTLTEYPELDQGSQEWLKARLGLVTASTVGQLLTIGTLGPLGYDCPTCSAPAESSCLSQAKGKGESSFIKTFHPARSDLAAANRHTSPPVVEVADNDASRNLTALLVSERINGWSDPTYYSADMARGHDVEPIARDMYAEHNRVKVTELGFMVRTLDSGARIGWSPDGLIDGNASIEIKAPRAKKHLLTILADQVPIEHMPQMQTGLLVSGREWMDFCSFYGGMRPFIKRVYADPMWFDVIVRAVETFEQNAAVMQAEYETKTTGLPDTERLLIDMEIF